MNSFVVPSQSVADRVRTLFFGCLLWFGSLGCEGGPCPKPGPAEGASGTTGGVPECAAPSFPKPGPVEGPSGAAPVQEQAKDQRGVFVDGKLGIRMNVPKFPMRKAGLVQSVGFGGPPRDGFAPHFGIAVDRASDRKTFLKESKADEERGAFTIFSQELLSLRPNLEAVLSVGESYPDPTGMKSIDLAVFHPGHTFLVGGHARPGDFKKYEKEFETCVRSFRLFDAGDRSKIGDLNWESYYLDPTYGIAVRAPDYGNGHKQPRIVVTFSGGEINPARMIPYPQLQIVIAEENLKPKEHLEITKKDTLSKEWTLVREETWEISGSKAPVLEVALGKPKGGAALTLAAVSDGERTFLLRGVRRLDDQGDANGAEIDACIKSFVYKPH